MENISNLLLAFIAFALCVWGIIVLIRLLKNVEERRLEIWLDFIKVFLGTFVVGLLGYFAKLSFDNRNLAIMESDQIGQYVEQAMIDDIDVRLRFAEYFNTVLPKERNAGWEDYYNELKEKQIKRELDKDSLRQLRDSLSNMSHDKANKSRYDKLVAQINQKQNAINLTEKVGSRHASIIDPEKNMLTSKDIANGQAVDATTRLPIGRVYMTCRINSPQSTEIVTINWQDSNQSLLHSKSYEIGRNEDAGYRLSSYKSFSEPGDYSVEVINGIGSSIGLVNFEVIE